MHLHLDINVNIYLCGQTYTKLYIFDRFSAKAWFGHSHCDYDHIFVCIVFSIFYYCKTNKKQSKYVFVVYLLFVCPIYLYCISSYRHYCIFTLLVLFSPLFWLFLINFHILFGSCISVRTTTISFFFFSFSVFLFFPLTNFFNHVTTNYFFTTTT